jgi:hypothetical protein
MRRANHGPQRKRIILASTDDAKLRADYVWRRLTTPGYYAEGYFWKSELDFLRAVTGNDSLELEED